MSTLHCPVVIVGKFAKNPNSDKLCVWNGPQGPIQFIDGTFNEGDKAVFIPKDSLVPVDDDRFKFLKDTDGRYPGYARIKAIKLRFVPSVGLLVKYNGTNDVGSDASIELGIKKWEPPQTHSFNMGERNQESNDHIAANIAPYDVENTWVFDNAITVDNNGDSCDAMDYVCVWEITEKIHGCNMRFYVDPNGVLHVGSRNVWLKEGANPWWNALNARRDLLEPLAKANPGIVFYGEVFGNVQDLKYGVDGVDVRLFDAYSLNGGKFLSPSQLSSILLFNSGRHYTATLKHTSEFLHVPSIDTFTGSLKEAIAYIRLNELHTGDSKLCKGQIKEGVVLRPQNDDVLVNSKKGYHRLITKVVSPDYLSRNGGTEHQ